MTLPCGSRPAVSGFFFVLACVFSGDGPQLVAQDLAWRGHAMTRDGLFHVSRVRWGNGVTSTGASVLIPLIEQAPEIVAAFRPRGTESTTRSPSREPWAGWDAYAAEQARSRETLERLARLAGVGSTGVPAPETIPQSGFRKLDPREFLPTDPWESVNPKN